MPTNEVINACRVLEKAGKKPSVALVKTKLTTKVPLALIVKGIQQFQSTLEFDQAVDVNIEVEKEPDTKIITQQDKCGCTEKLISLEKELSVMAAHITSLQAQVKALTEL